MQAACAPLRAAGAATLDARPGTSLAAHEVSLALPIIATPYNPGPAVLRNAALPRGACAGRGCWVSCAVVCTSRHPACAHSCGAPCLPPPPSPPPLPATAIHHSSPPLHNARVAQVRALADKICQNPIIIDLKGKDAVPETGQRPTSAAHPGCQRMHRRGCAASLTAAARPCFAAHHHPCCSLSEPPKRSLYFPPHSWSRAGVVHISFPATCLLDTQRL